MSRTTRVCAWIVLSLAVVAGCSKSDATSSTSAQTGDSGAQADANSNPIGRAASEWLTAVLKGDTQRASALLTPQAMQRIIASGKQFAPPGLETATFTLGDVRELSQEQAVVQCILTDTSGGSANSEEMCCLMRRVDNDWRVSGIAYGTAPNQPWTLTNFETGMNTPISRPTASNVGTGGVPYAPQNSGDAVSRPSPPRTAQESTAAERR
jgi:hypothetical protein